MLNALKEITTYDFLGFLIPGMTIMLAILAFFGLVTQTEISLGLSFTEDTSAGWLVFVVASYVLGNIAQGVGNKVFRDRSVDGVDQAQLEAARKRLRDRKIIGDGHVKDREICDLCDLYMLNSGNGPFSNARDIYIFREGFYRGITVALGIWVVVGISMLAILAATKLPLFTLSSNLSTSSTFVFGGCLIFTASAMLTYQRYKRFKEYRQKHAVNSFLIDTAPANRGLGVTTRSRITT